MVGGRCCIKVAGVWQVLGDGGWWVAVGGG